MNGIKNLWDSILYFLTGLFMTLVIFIILFLLGKGIYSAVQLHMEKDNFVRVSAEVTDIEEYSLIHFLKDKDYKITYAYEYGDDIYYYTKDVRTQPNQNVGSVVTLHMDLVSPTVIKEQLSERIFLSIVVLLIVISVVVLWNSKNKSSYMRIYPLDPEKIIYNIRRKNQKQIRWIIRGIMALILASALTIVSDSTQIRNLLVIIIVLLVVSVGVMVSNIAIINKLDDERFELVYDCCMEKGEEDYGDSKGYYLVLEETEKVFSVSGKAYREVKSGDEICLIYFDRSRKKPYLMCIEKR